MDSKIFVLIIIGIVFTFGYLERRQKAQIKANNNRQADVDEKTKAEINELRERVETLERIVTDKSTRLREEIDAL